MKITIKVHLAQIDAKFQVLLFLAHMIFKFQTPMQHHINHDGRCVKPNLPC